MESKWRRTGEFLRKFFQILMAESDGVQASEALKRLAGQVELTAYESGDYESAGRRFEEIVRFATVDCVKAGWLAKEKGVLSVTDEGRRAYAEFVGPEAFYGRARKLYAEWKASQPDAEPPAAADITLVKGLQPEDTGAPDRRHRRN